MRAWKVALLVLGLVAIVVFLAAAVFGLYLTLSGRGSGNVEWTRLAEAPPGAGAMNATRFHGSLLDDFEAAKVGEGGLFEADSYDGFFDDARAAGGVPTREGCYAVTVEAIPIEFCPGAM